MKHSLASQSSHHIFSQCKFQKECDDSMMLASFIKTAIAQLLHWAQHVVIEAASAETQIRYCQQQGQGLGRLSGAEVGRIEIAVQAWQTNHGIGRSPHQCR